MDYVRMTEYARKKALDLEALEMHIAQCSGFVKMMCGVANNCAISIVRQAWMHIADIRDKDSYRDERPHTPHPGCKQKAKQAYAQFFREWQIMETALLYPAEGDVRFFHVDDMPPESRKKYGEMTDSEFFEFWKGTGALAYQKAQPLVTSLHNKFRKAFEHHGLRSPDQGAWAMVATTALELAVDNWNSAMLSCHEALEYAQDLEYLKKIWRPFSPERCTNTWERAMNLMDPAIAATRLDYADERNIELGVEQLRELWISAGMPFDSTIEAVKAFDRDIFRTRGEAKKSIRQLTEMKNDAESMR